MKKLAMILRLTFCLMCFNVSNIYAICFIEDVECIAPLVLPNYDNDKESEKEWASSNGIVIANKNKVTARFRFDQESIGLLKYNDDLGLEVEMVFKGSDREKIKLKSVISSFPYSSRAGKDTNICDSTTNRGNEAIVFAIHLLNLKDLEANVDYFVVFEFKDNFPDSGITLKPGLQLTMNIGPLKSLPNIRWISWFDQFQYYALETEHYNPFQVHPDEWNGVKWSSKTESTTFNSKPKEKIVEDLNGQDPEENISDGIAIDGSTNFSPENSYYNPNNIVTTPNPYTNSTDIHITHCKIRPYKEGSWHNEVDIDLGPGESFDLEMEVRTRNKSNHNLEDVDVDYLVMKDKKDFDPDKRCRLEDEKVDIKEGEKESKHSGRIRVSTSEDLKIITVSGKHSFNFPITEQNIKERESTLYFYTDVETKDESDRDVSSEFNSDERGKLEIQLFSNTARFSASPLSGNSPLTVNFTDQSLGGNITDWDWSFGDGNITNVVNPTNIYINPGTYSASLAVTNQNGEVRIFEKIITVMAAVPSITITNPTSSDKWKSDKDHTIRWNSKNLPHQEPIKIEYTCDGGKHWRTIHDGYTGNDGSKKWKKKKSKTKDTSNAYIRILRRSDNSVLGISPKFKIDHKKKTPKW